MTERVEGRRDTPHQQCWDLLPWHINGTLDAAQSQRVEAHLAQCEECRREHASQLSLRQLMRTEEAVLHTPHASLQKLMATIDREAEATPDDAPQRNVKRRVMNRSRWLAVAVVVEAACVVMLVGTLSWQMRSERSAPRYSTLTSPDAAMPGGADARIVFAPAVAVADVNNLLRAYDAHIIAGPTAAGVFTLALPATMNAADIETAIEKLQRDPRVRFAEPTPPRGGEAR